MKLFLPYRPGTDFPAAVQRIFEARGHECVLFRYTSAEKLRRACQKIHPDAVLSTQSDLLHRLPEQKRIYLGTEFHCPEKLNAADWKAVTIPHADLSFSYITMGAKDRTVLPCGVPLPQHYRVLLPREKCLQALGLRAQEPLFLLLTDGAAAGEIKSTVRAIDALCPPARSVVLCKDAARCKLFTTAFAEFQNVYVLPLRDNLSLALCAADAVFTPATPIFVCAAARQGKIVILLHTPSPRARQNAEYLDSRGIAFRGKTAADNVSYAGRLLESQRLRKIMLDAQEKFILPDAEERLVCAAEKIANTD